VASSSLPRKGLPPLEIPANIPGENQAFSTTPVNAIVPSFQEIRMGRWVSHVVASLVRHG